MFKFFQNTIILLFIFCFNCLCSERIQLKERDKSIEYHYSLIEGIKHKYIGSLKSSFALFNNTLSISDSSAVGNYELSNLYLLQSGYQDALKFANRACILDPDNAWYKIHKADILLSLKMYQECIDVYKDLITLQPDDVEIKHQLAKVYVRLNKNDAALKIYEDIDNEYGTFKSNSIYKFHLLFELEDYKAASNELKKLIEIDPYNSSYYNYKGQLFLVQNDTLGAINSFNVALKYNGNDPVATKSLINIYLQYKNYDAVLHFLNLFYSNSFILDKDKISFYVSFSSLLNHFSSSFSKIDSVLNDFLLEYPSLTSKSIYADFLVRSENYSKAQVILKDLIVLNKYNPLYWEQLINIYNITDLPDSVVEYSLRAISIYKEVPIFYLYCGLGYLRVNHDDLAYDILLKGLRVCQSTKSELAVEFYIYLGDICYRLGKYNDSDLYFEKALDLDSNNIVVLNNYAYYLALREVKLVYAKNMSYRTIVVDSLNPTYLDTYAWILYKLEDYINAKKYLEFAISNGGDTNSEILHHYGDVLFKLNSIEEAVNMWKKALIHNSTDSELQIKIEKHSN